MSDKSVGMVIDGHQCTEVEVETGVIRGLPLSPILFTMYQSGVFREVDEEVE